MSGLNSGHIVLTNASVLDVVGGVVIPHQVVFVSDGLIREVGAAGTVKYPAEAVVLDCEGGTVMPGLIDCHVHVTSVTADLIALAQESPLHVGGRAVKTLEEMLRRGFTTVRDVGGADYGLADLTEQGHVNGPRVWFGGKAISQTGGHGDFRTQGQVVIDDHRCCSGIGVVADGVPEVRRAAREQFRTGADHIKLMLSGGVGSPTDRIGSTQYSVEEIRAAVEEAEAYERYVAAHAYTARAINRALANGVRSIEHGNLLDETSVEHFLRADAYYVPTIIASRSLADPRTSGLQPVAQAKVDWVLERGMSALEQAHRAGVKIAFGTDLLGSFQERQLEELSIRAEVQAPIDVIRSATVVSSEMALWGDRLGQVKAGYLADLVVTRRDPLEYFADLYAEDHRYVISRGRIAYVDGEPQGLT
ncbi:amidohydrolase family protein [Leucobacter sp. GX24907]